MRDNELIPADSTKVFLELNKDMFILSQSSKIFFFRQNEVIFPKISKDEFLTFLLISFVNETIAISNSKDISKLLNDILDKGSFFFIICLIMNSKI